MMYSMSASAVRFKIQGSIFQKSQRCHLIIRYIFKHIILKNTASFCCKIVESFWSAKAPHGFETKTTVELQLLEHDGTMEICSRQG